MSSVRKIGDYVESDIKSIFTPGSIEISGRIASWLRYGLDSYFNYPLVYLLRKFSNFDPIFGLQIEDQPTEFPVYPLKALNLNETETHIPPIKESENRDSIFDFEKLKGILTKCDKWPYLTIEDYHNAYKLKKITPLKVAETLIQLCNSEKIKNYNAIVEIHENDILEAAKASTERYESDNAISVVDGVPFFVKEHIKIKKYSVYGGMYGNEGHLSDETAFCVQKLINAGALFVGTTSMPILGCNPFGLNTATQNRTVKNIWDENRYAGGSSSGNGIVVGLGLCPFSIGSDSLGSIRIPSAHCGIVGLRTTFGRISNTNCTIDFNKNPYMTVGPMACCVSDAAIVYYIMAGPDFKFIHGINQPIPRIPSDSLKISDIRFGLFSEYNNVADNSRITQILIVCEYLKLFGCSVKGIKIPEIQECLMSSFCELIFFLAEIANEFDKRGKKYLLNDVNIQICQAIGNGFKSDDLIKLQKQRTRSIKIMENIFKEVDIVIMPTTSRFSPLISEYHQTCGFFDQAETTHQTHFCSISSFCGLPSIVLNISYEKNTGFPISIQLISEWWNEDLLLFVANIIEKNYPLIETPADFTKMF